MVDNHRVTNKRLYIVETDVATLYGLIFPQVQTRLEMTEVRWDATHKASRLELYANLQVFIKDFERYVTTRFVEIEMSYLGYIREEVDIF